MSDCDNIVIEICGGSKLTFSDMPCDNLRIEGADDVTINQGVGIDLTDGVHAYDGSGNEIPFSVEPDEIDKCEVGEHIVKYTAEGEGDMMLPTLCGKNRLHISSMCDNAIIQEERVVSITQADPPVISGADDMEVNVGTVFDPMNGVSAVDDNGNEIEVEISGTYPRTANGEKLVSFDDGNGSLAESVKVTFEPHQDGTPSLAGTDYTPYLYRSAPSFGQPYSRQRPTVIGGSVGWNQLLQNGNFADTSAWQAIGCTLSVADNIGTLTAASSGSTYLYQPTDIPQGHKVFAVATVKGEAEHSSMLSFGTGSIKNYTLTTSWQTVATIAEKPASGNNFNVVRIGSGVATGEKIYVKDVNLIDLTALWGASVADAIYAMEQSVSGSGVAYFKSLFGEDYYAYNSGSLESVQTSGHKIVGKNLFDVSAYEGFYDDYDYYSSGYRCKIIPLLPNTTYTVSQSSGVAQTSPIMLVNSVRGVNGSGYLDCRSASVTKTFTTDESGNLYIGVYANSTSEAVDARLNAINLQIELGSTATAYEPYEEWLYPLDSDLVLRGVPKWIDGGLRYDGDRYLPNGTVDRRYGVVDLGSLNWSQSGSLGAGHYSTSLPTHYRWGNDVLMMCAKYVFDGIGNSDRSYYGADKTLRYYYTSTVPTYEIYIHDSAYTSASDFTTAMSGVMLVYELATPTTESADPYTALQMADPSGTEEWVTSGIVPVGQETEYRAVYDVEGYDEIDTYVSGTNLWNEQWEVGEYNIVTGEKIGSSGVRCKALIPIVGDTTYRFYCASRDTEMYGYCFYDSKGNFINGSLTTGSTITAPSNAKYVSFFMPNSWYGSVYQNDISVNYPSSEVGYNPYVGNEYTTDLGGTVYGGTLDVVSGELTVTWGYIASYNGETIGEPWKSNIDEYVAGTTPSVGAEVAYTLSTPQTIQLTPQEVETLLGDNIYISPQGNVVEVIYRADIPQEGTITLDTLGEANITYTATDECGNSTEVERTVDIEQYRTVLYSDGTFIINERSSDIPANITEHGTETATYDPLDENHDYHFATEPPWYSNRLLVTKVEIGSRIQPVYMDYWFTYFRNCTEFDLSNISISYLSSADHTFNKCSSVEEIDISMLHNVTGTRSMFRDCSSLKTIYASDDFPAQNVGGADTFNSCTQLVGGSGTTYDANHIDYTYAHIDGGTSNPGYFTAKGV